MSMPKTISGTIDAWFTNSYYGPADIERNPDKAAENLHYSSHDMSDVDGWSRAGKATITIELLTADEMIGAKVDSLKAAKTKMMADHQQALTNIDSKIQQLLAITMTEAA